MITLRPVEQKDKELLFKWRNDPAVYKFLFHPEPISWENHVEWLTKTISNPQITFLMAMADNKECGTVRFDFTADRREAEVGIYVAPEFMGKGLSPQILGAGEKWILGKEPAFKKFNARVLLENEKSHKLFQNLNYKPQYTGYVKKV
jgi:RimJ/RimL family protein N-acetyltransferase